MVRDIPQGTIVDGRYRVIARVGAGGMADVYGAEDTQLGRRVALKLLHRRFAEDREFVERFRREASSAAGLQHPNVVGVFDRGEWDGTSYIAMEYLEGRTLKQVIDEESPMDPIRAIDLVVQILRAARFAHRRGVIHRDLKPHNVIVDAEARAKVTDFGIARAGASDMTQTGSIMGTAQYLSPEQAQGHAVTPQSDLYSIGIVLYELLAGRLPFDGESAVTIALKQVNEAPLPPSAFNGAVTPELEGVVLHALEKDPAHRFPDADAFILALDRARAHIAEGSPEGQTVGFVPVGPPLEGVPPAAESRRRRPWWIALVVAALIIAAALAFALTRPAKRDVPNVTGKPVQAALAILQNAGFNPTVQRTTSDVPVDTVLRQNPQPGQREQAGSEVALIVSQGPGDRPVPDVLDRSRDAAVKALRDAGFKVRQQRQPSDTVRAGRVISTTPGAATLVQIGSPVTVVVSTGPQQVAVPDVVGQARSDASDTLRTAGFGVSVQQQEDPRATPGTVLSQSPPAGTRLARGQTVALTVAQRPQDVAVPGVTGRTANTAVNALSDAGFVPNQTSESVTSRAQDGRVLRQSPPSGRRAKRGSRVTIVVGRYTPPTVPSPGGGATTPTTPTTPTAPPPPTTPAPGQP